MDKTLRARILYYSPTPGAQSAADTVDTHGAQGASTHKDDHKKTTPSRKPEVRRVRRKAATDRRAEKSICAALVQRHDHRPGPGTQPPPRLGMLTQPRLGNGAENSELGFDTMGAILRMSCRYDLLPV